MAPPSCGQAAVKFTTNGAVAYVRSGGAGAHLLLAQWEPVPVVAALGIAGARCAIGGAHERRERHAA